MQPVKGEAVLNAWWDQYGLTGKTHRWQICDASMHGDDASTWYCARVVHGKMIPAKTSAWQPGYPCTEHHGTTPANMIKIAKCGQLRGRERVDDSWMDDSQREKRLAGLKVGQAGFYASTNFKQALEYAVPQAIYDGKGRGYLINCMIELLCMAGTNLHSGSTARVHKCNEDVEVACFLVRFYDPHTHPPLNRFNWQPHLSSPNLDNFVQLVHHEQPHHERSQQLVAEAVGVVQNVSFRAYIEDYASKHDILGCVCNNWKNGSLQVVAEGSRSVLQELLHAITRGPGNFRPKSARARVDCVWYCWSQASGNFRSFFRAKHSLVAPFINSVTGWAICNILTFPQPPSVPPPERLRVARPTRTPLQVDDTRFATARLERDIRCDGCGKWCQGNEAGCFEDTRRMPVAEQRKDAWEQGVWTALWYCVQCYMDYYQCSEAVIFEWCGFSERRRKKRAFQMRVEAGRGKRRRIAC